MSAWLCSATHVAAIVAFYARDRYCSWTWLRMPDARPEGVATMLHQENVRSVFGRYGDSASDFGPPHEFSAREIERAPVLTPVEVLKAVGCLRYQSCEHEEWEGSNAERFLRAVEASAIAALPGYDAAPWGIDDPRPFAGAPMSARVYLFADSGAGMKFVRSFKWNPLDWNERDFERAILKRFPAMPCDRFGVLRAAWWLVECESAEAGRAIIANAATRARLAGRAYDAEDLRGVFVEVEGRILASGGAA